MWEFPFGQRFTSDVLGKTDFDTYPADLAAEFWALSKAVMDSGVPVINQEERGLDSQGKPVWVLLPHHMTDWRWLTERTDSPWYPGVMRLFRRSVRADWSAVIAEVRLALDQFVRARVASS